MADADTAAMLLRPFRIENLTDVYVDSFGKIVGRYGQQWATELLRTWFGGKQLAWAYGGGEERPQWVADWLPGLCKGLHATGLTPGAHAAQRLVDLAWEWIGQDIGTGLASSSPSRRDKKLDDLGKPLASVLTAAAAIGAASTRDTVSGYIRKQEDAVSVLEMSALRAAAELPRDGARGDASFGDLAADCAVRLRSRLARPRRAPGDWSIELPAGGCTCELCDTLRVFAADKNRRTAPERPEGDSLGRSRSGRVPTPTCPGCGRSGWPASTASASTPGGSPPAPCWPGSPTRAGAPRSTSSPRPSRSADPPRRQVEVARRPSGPATTAADRPPAGRPGRRRRNSGRPRPTAR